MEFLRITPGRHGAYFKFPDRNITRESYIPSEGCHPVCFPELLLPTAGVEAAYCGSTKTKNETSMKNEKEIMVLICEDSETAKKS